MLRNTPARLANTFGTIGVGLSTVISLSAFLALAGCGTGESGPSPLSGTIQGTVNSRQLAASGAGSAPSLQNLTVRVDGSNATAAVNPDGTFAFPSVPPGTYTVSVVGAVNAGAHATVEVGPGKRTAIALNLLPAGQVAGIVSTSSSQGLKPASKITVTLSSSSAPRLMFFKPMEVDPQLTASGKPVAGGSLPPVISPPPPAGSSDFQLKTTTADDGTYSFPGVPAGFYSVRASDGDLSASALIDVFPSHTTAADLTLRTSVQEGAAIVSGVVLGKDASGTHPLRGAFIRFEITPPFCGGGGVPPPLSGGGSGGSGGGFAGGIGVATPGSSGSAQTGGGVLIGSGLVTGSSTIAQSGIVPPAPCPVPGADGRLGVMIPIGAVTDDQGHYSVKVPVYVTALVAALAGFEQSEQEVHLVAGGSANVDFTLQQLTPVPVLTATITADGVIVDAGPPVQGGPGSTVPPNGAIPGVPPPGGPRGVVFLQPGAPLSLTLRLTNSGTAPAEVKVAGVGDALRLVDSSGSVLWNIDNHRAQPASIVPRTLAPGQEITLHEQWPGTDDNGVSLAAGKYEFVGEVAGVKAEPLALVETTDAPPGPPVGPPSPLPVR